MRLIFLLLLFVSTIYSCSGSAEHYVPAISGDDGTLIKVEITLNQGTGKIYTSINPPIGLSTQNSMTLAVHQAFEYASYPLRNCDVFVSFDLTDVEYIDGPSAGAALTLITYSALENLELRDDAIITGEIDQFGVILPVGGLYEKSMSAINNGFRYIVIPILSVHEAVLLNDLNEEYGLEFIEVENLDQAINFFVYNQFPDTNPFEIENRTLENLTIIEIDEDLESFREISEKLIEIEINVLEDFESPKDLEELDSYFKNEVKNQEDLLDFGYIFTAANEAFMDYIDLSTIANADDPDVESKYAEIQACLDSLQDVEKNSENFEWVISAELRKQWARYQLDNIDLGSAVLVEEKYVLYNDLMYADAWCKVSDALFQKSAKIEGDQLDESEWEHIASNLFNATKNIPLDNMDYERHLFSAYDLYDEGKYGAAIYDALYVYELYSADQELIDMGQDELNGVLFSLSNQTRFSLWGKIYQTQGQYLAQGDLASKMSGFRILKYSKALDEVNVQMKVSSIGIDLESIFCLPELFFFLLFSYLVIHKH